MVYEDLPTGPYIQVWKSRRRMCTLTAPSWPTCSSLFFDCPQVVKVILGRDGIAVVLRGSDEPVKLEDLGPQSQVRVYLESIPDLM